MLKRLDHVNVRTANLAAMIDWYRDVLGLKPGNRPPFSFDGAWMYCGEWPIVHLVGVDQHPVGEAPRLEHFAVSAEGLDEFLTRLERLGVDYQTNVVPGFEIIQVNIWDPDENHIHIDFAPSEMPALRSRVPA